MPQNLSLEYVAGLFDGEGSFCISFVPGAPPAINFLDVKPLVQIPMFRAEDVFKKLQEKFGGIIYKNGRVVPCWKINSLNGCLNFAESTFPYLRVRRENCRVFIKILKRMHDGFHYSDEGILWIAKQREKLSKGKHRYKWTVERIQKFLQTHKKAHRRFSRDEDEFIIKNQGKLTQKQIGKELGRTEHVIHERVARLRQRGKL